MEEMEKIRENIHKELCKLLEKSGQIILNSKEECLEDRLQFYQDIIENTQEINEIINYIISETEHYNY
jgi:hypothetical protein